VLVSYALAPGPLAVIPSGSQSRSSVPDVPSKSATLIRRSLDVRSYDRDFSDALIEAGRAAESEAWATRCVAALLLQRQFILLPPRAIEEHDRLFVRLRLKQREGLEFLLRKSVITEGFSSRRLSIFIREWRRKMSRSIGCFEGPFLPAAVHRIERYAQSDCKLPLARYLFTPEEVVAEILRRTRISRGEELPLPPHSELVLEESALSREGLPPYERRILELLSDPGKIFWMAQQPISELNSLVEYPRGTVALVIKPPGGLIEFELKRCGVPGPQPLSAVFDRHGARVPDSHRLHAGSMGWHLIFEARAAARLNRIYRLIHGVSASVSVTHCLKSICSIPTPKGERSTVDFFNFRDAFGEGFEAMRAELKKCVKTAIEANDIGVKELPGEMGPTINFLMQSWPAQALQSNTSSFRLDRLAAYLSPHGPRLYFQDAPRITKDELQWLASQLLDEILPRRARPAGSFAGFNQHIDKVFALAINRQRADKIFMQLMRQLGAFWGTLAGIKAYSNGESLVARNVGLRATWLNGNWGVSLFFLDHDDLHIADPTDGDLPLERVLRGMVSDQLFCIGCPDRPYSKSTLSALAKIYRVNQEVLAQGRLALRKARDAAVRKTRRKLKHNIALRNNFSPNFLKRAEDCDKVCAAFAKRRKELRTQPSLLDRIVRTHLPASAYDETRIGQYVQSLQNSAQHFLLNPGI